MDFNSESRAKPEFFQLNDKGSVLYDPSSVPKLQFRNWYMGIDSPSAEIRGTESPEQQLDPDNMLSEADITKITESTITFFVGSALLFLAATILILILVGIHKALRNRSIQQEENRKNEQATADALKKVVLHPVRTLDIPHAQLQQALDSKHASIYF